MKEEKKKIIFSTPALLLCIISILLCVADILCTVFLLGMSKLYTILWLVGCGILIVASFVFWIVGLKSWQKLTFVVVAIASLVLWVYWILVMLGLKSIFATAESLQKAVASTGGWGMLVYVLIQFLQVTFIPLPAMVTTLAGTALFGPLLATILSFVGILLGSVFAFWLGDKFGEKICAWIVGKETTEKYSKMLYEKGKYLFFLMMLFPFFPDDALCLIAGMTSMSFRYFIGTILLTRPIGIFMTCYLGSGQIIPYAGWGWIVWGILIAIMIALFVCAYKFQPQIEEWLGKIASKFASKKKRIKLQVEQQEIDDTQLNKDTQPVEKNRALTVIAPKEQENQENKDDT